MLQSSLVFKDQSTHREAVEVKHEAVLHWQYLAEHTLPKKLKYSLFKLHLCQRLLHTLLHTPPGCSLYCTQSSCLALTCPQCGCWWKSGKKSAHFSTATICLPANHPSRIQRKAKEKRCSLLFLSVGGTGWGCCVSLWIWCLFSLISWFEVFVVALTVSDPANHRDNQVFIIKVKVRRMERFFGLLTIVPVQSNQVKTSPNRDPCQDKRVLSHYKLQRSCW